MKTGNYSIAELLEDRDLEQFVIPEIQRDYVWETNDVSDFLTYLLDDFKVNEEPYLGFIYAYNDRDFPYKYFLIDGQQRITTLYLLLLACYHKQGKNLPDYFFNRQYLKIDYKVRQSTHDFLLDMVNFCKNHPDLHDFDIKHQIWYHREYKNDRTITNIINNYDFIRKWLNSSVSESGKFIKFVETNVKLSYYDIEESRQGEDLYIYMNSRGRQLEPNETLKAKFLTRTKEKDYWGSKWELWQDFFWQRKGKRPDADAGFNDFLRMVQIITMSQKNISSAKISDFAAGRQIQAPTIDMLPDAIEELELYFEAFKWLATKTIICDFFQKYETDSYVASPPNFERRQIFFFRILPILAFLSVTTNRDENVILRFVRFFYNISRKSGSVGKDIANQLPNAIKLMHEYGKSKTNGFDIFDLIEYSKGRTVLINEEEIIKLSLYKSSGNSQERARLETLFWQAEDHKIFQGEIAFLLNRYYNVQEQNINISTYTKTWDVFQNLFSESNDNSSNIARALLYYGNTWIRDTPNYYQNYDCQNWYLLVRSDTGKYLTMLLEDLHDKPIDYIDTIIRDKMREYFVQKKSTTVSDLKAETNLFDQIRILCALDFYSEQKLFKSGNGYISKDDRYAYGDTHFFTNSPELFNTSRYINEGYEGRIMSILKKTLTNEERVIEIISNILNFKSNAQ